MIFLLDSGLACTYLVGVNPWKSNNFKGLRFVKVMPIMVS